MTTRYCPRCQGDVEEAGGFCLLGHRLSLEPVGASLSQLETGFDDAAEQAIGQVFGAPPPPPDAPAPQPSDKRSAQAAVYRRLEDISARLDEDDPIAAFAPPPRMDWGPRRPSVMRGVTGRRLMSDA